MGRNNRPTLSPEQDAYLRSVIPGTTGAEQAAAMLKRFGVRMSATQLKAWRGNHHAFSGLTGRFEKGHVSPNKGVPMPPSVYAKAKATMFGKGHRPWNDRYEIGERRIVRWHDGERKAWFEKVSDRGGLWERWRPVSRLTLERAGRPVPKGFVVAHIDGDSLNDDIANLAVVEQSLYPQMNRKKLISADPETMAAGKALAKMCSKANRLTAKARKKRKKD